MRFIAVGAFLLLSFSNFAEACSLICDPPEVPDTVKCKCYLPTMYPPSKGGPPIDLQNGKCPDVPCPPGSSKKSDCSCAPSTDK